MIVTGRWRNRARVIEGRLIEFGEPDRFYQNDGSGQFKEVPWTSGMFLDEAGRPLKEDLWDMGLSVMFRDINQDSHPDLYVCNDFQQPDRVWLNDGKGRFRAIPRESIRLSSYFSMGVDFGDLNRDGYDDFFVVDMMSRSHSKRMTQGSPPVPPISVTLEAALDRPQHRRNMLYLNRADGTYAEVAQLAGLPASDWSWCPVFIDVDLDGYEDILAVNGYSAGVLDLDILEYNQQFPENSPKRKDVTEYAPLETPNVAFRNQHDMTFDEVGSDWGFDSERVSQGIGLADLDNDGDLDVVVNCLNAAPLLLRNECSLPRIAVQLEGAKGNTHGIGARIVVKGGPVEQSQEMISGGRYLASDAAMRVFAAGTLDRPLTIEVNWRSGHRSVIKDVSGNRIYRIVESESEIDDGLASTTARDAVPLFEDVSDQLDHEHRDAPYNDFVRQPALSQSLSNLGPGVAWLDLNGDHRDDLVIGSGRGGGVGFYKNDGQGGLGVDATFKSDPERDDIVGLAAFGIGSTGPLFVGGVTNYEGRGEASRLRFYTSNGFQAEISLPDPKVSIGPIVVGDLDHDGDLDLVVGGRCKPGQVPLSASSFVFKNQGGEFVLDSCNNEALADIGMVSGMVLSDLDGDSWLDLVIASSWGGIKVLMNQSGCFVEKTNELGLEPFKGIWNGVATGDFNNDGRLDIIATNWGQNTRFELFRAKPIHLSYSNVGDDQMIQFIEGYYSPEFQHQAPFRLMEAQGQIFPRIRDRFKTHADYSTASISDIWDENERVETLEVSVFETMLFLNYGDRFEAKPLPLVAQFAPAFGIGVADFDGDGNEDVFLSQNFSHTSKEIAPMEAGRGLLLLGDGGGEFLPMTSSESGILIYGDQRGAAVSDFDGDGRVDLVVAQNQSAVRLFRNRQAEPGLTVRLKWEAGNPMAIGASLRLGVNGKLGPIRELQAGSGYWSQNSLTQVLGKIEEADQLWVRWPDGSITTTEIPDAVASVVINSDGELIQ